MTERIYLSPPHLTEDALIYLQDAVRSNWIAPVGPHIEHFENELAQILDVPHVLTTNSGTSAIHLALLSLEVGPNDEVICPTFTFCASANPIVYCGATPIFVDSDPESWNMDVGLLESAIKDTIAQRGKKPKVIIVVHLYGMPAEMDRIMEVSRRYEIPVVEDAAEALGSSINGRMVGTFGKVGILSFNGNKIITTSGGGALFSSDAALMEKARYLRQEARDPLHYYQHRSIGYNYRLSNLLAAVGRSQLKVLADRVRTRRETFQFYYDELKHLPSVQFQGERKGAKSNRWLTTIVDGGDRSNCENIRLALERENIESRPLWKPLHLQPVFDGYPKYLNGVSEYLFSQGLCLPSGSAMTEESLNQVASIIKQNY